MGFNAMTVGTASTFWFYLAWVLLANISTSNNTALNITNTTSSPLLTTVPLSCVLPNFLQTNCTGSTIKICEWHLGKRLALPRWQNLSPPSKFRGLRGTSEWTWTVVNSTIIVKHSTFDARNFQPLGRKTHSILKCVTNRGLASNTFMISKKEMIAEKQDTNETFSCIRFLKRSETVIQYELGSWKRRLKDVVCQDNKLVLQEDLLISDHYGILDCPLELRGSYEIIHIYDAQNKRTCTYSQRLFGVFESDCLSKEGLYIDFGKGHNCTSPDIGNRYPQELNLRCIGKAWQDGGFTYFVTVRRDRWLPDYEETASIQCVRFKMTSGLEDEFILTIFNQPICKGLVSDEEQLGKNDDVLSLRIRRRKTPYISKFDLDARCQFPNEMQGTWLEQSTHQGRKKILIEGGNISISPYGSFECKERFPFNQGHQSICGFGPEGDRWLGQGQVRFYYDDYAILSRFDNGCRPRITRLGITSTVNKHALVYRLSQSEPLVNDGRSPEDFYKHEILERFCKMAYLYERDPYPYWGRNIEKVIHREKLPARAMSKCSLVLNSRHVLLAVVAGTESSLCTNSTSWMHFGCPESTQAMTSLKLSYSPSCIKKDLTFSCIGKAWKFGNYVLLRDVVTQRINCFWFDKESNAIFRLESSQCSDSDWGRLPGHESHFDEKFTIKYFEKCPKFVPLPPTKGGRSGAGFAAVDQIIWLLPLISLYLQNVMYR